MDVSGYTAIARTKLSSPMAYLDSQDLLTGTVLDYGCGRGFDADMLGLAKYDPNWHPDTLAVCRRYDTITCNYVLNVIEDKFARAKVVRRLLSLLKEGGKAYISVRANVNTDGYTSKGTWQGNIFLELPLIKSTRQYRMYLLAKDGNEC